MSARLLSRIGDFFDNGGVLERGESRLGMYAAMIVAGVTYAGLQATAIDSGATGAVLAANADLVQSFPDTPGKIAVIDRTGHPPFVEPDKWLFEISARFPEGVASNSTEGAAFDDGVQCLVFGAHPAMTAGQILWRAEGTPAFGGLGNKAAHAYVVDVGVARCLGLETGGPAEAFAVLKGISRGDTAILPVMQDYWRGDAGVRMALARVEDYLAYNGEVLTSDAGYASVRGMVEDVVLGLGDDHRTDVVIAP
jgi:hypothetical protein